MKVTGVPAHIVPVGFAVTVTDGVILELILIVILLEFAVGEVMQVEFEVRVAVIISPVVSDELLYVEELLPTIPPFNFHW